MNKMNLYKINNYSIIYLKLIDFSLLLNYSIKIINLLQIYSII